MSQMDKGRQTQTRPQEVSETYRRTQIRAERRLTVSAEVDAEGLAWCVVPVQWQTSKSGRKKNGVLERKLNATVVGLESQSTGMWS